MMFWDRVAGVYDLFVNGYNRRVHQKLKKAVAIARLDRMKE